VAQLGAQGGGPGEGDISDGYATAYRPMIISVSPPSRRTALNTSCGSSRGGPALVNVADLGAQPFAVNPLREFPEPYSARSCFHSPNDRARL
jgi:hypothetical protein